MADSRGADDMGDQVEEGLKVQFDKKAKLPIDDDIGVQVEEGLKEYFFCALRKSKPRISVAVCHQKRCLFLESEGGKFKCSYRNYVDPKKTGGKSASN